jgi:hypothetical protein
MIKQYSLIFSQIGVAASSDFSTFARSLPSIFYRPADQPENVSIVRFQHIHTMVATNWGASIQTPQPRSSLGKFDPFQARNIWGINPWCVKPVNSMRSKAFNIQRMKPQPLFV